MKNNQTFENMGNSTVNVDAGKAADPMQMLAFDNLKKIENLKTWVIGLILLSVVSVGCNVAMMLTDFQDKRNARVEYDKLRYINKEMQSALDRIEGLSE